MITSDDFFHCNNERGILNPSVENINGVVVEGEEFKIIRTSKDGKGR